MSINLVPEHALPKSSFLEEGLSSSGGRIASEPARTGRAELSDRSSSAFEAVGRDSSQQVYLKRPALP
jgi:hypothetical protein